MNTAIDPSTLTGATTSNWALLKNATITFIRVLSTAEDAVTGNQIPVDTESLTVPAYFKKSALGSDTGRGEPIDTGRGVPIGSYKVEGYTVGILPDWAKEPFQPRLNCTWDFLGSGILTLEGKGQVVKEQVERTGEGSQVYGYFTMQGGSS